MNCADFGVPQERYRLFIVARRDGRPIAWQTPTHGPASSGLLPYRTARDVIDWDHPGQPVTHCRSPWVMERIEQGLAAFGGEPFLVPRKQGNNRYVRSVDRPLMTIVASRPCISLVQRRGRRVYRRFLTITEYLRAMSFPEDYILGDDVTREDKERMIGNAVPPAMMEALVTTLFRDDPASRAAA